MVSPAPPQTRLDAGPPVHQKATAPFEENPADEETRPALCRLRARRTRRRRDVDVRPLPCEEGAPEVRLLPGRAMAAASPARLREAGRRMLGQLRFARGPGDDESPLLSFLHRAALDEGEGLRRGGLLRADAGERGEVPGDRAQPADPDRGLDRPGAGRDEGAE